MCLLAGNLDCSDTWISFIIILESEKTKVISLGLNKDFNFRCNLLFLCMRRHSMPIYTLYFCAILVCCVSMRLAEPIPNEIVIDEKVSSLNPRCSVFYFYLAPNG